MKIRILGCSGGIGGRHLRTTSMLVDHDVLVDAGTGVADLSLAELGAIDHIFLTHSHLDHIASLPLLIDTVMDMRIGRPVTVHASEATLAILRQHVFNWLVWPDFSEIPSREASLPAVPGPWSWGQRVDLGCGRSITALPAEHTVPAVGYLLDSGSNSLAFSGDTTSNDSFWLRGERGCQPALPHHRDGPSPTRSGPWPSPPSTSVQACWRRSWPSWRDRPRFSSPT